MATPKHIPGVDVPDWLSKKWLVELIGVVPPLVVAGLAAYKLMQDSETASLGYISAGAVIWMLAASVTKVGHARKQDQSAMAQRSHDGLRAALRVLHAATGHACRLDPTTLDKNLRVTFHRVVPPIENAEEIEQIVDYVGGDGGGAGRRFSVRSGITGLCIRTCEPHTMCRETGDAAEYRKVLEADWSYTRADAAKLSIDRFSSMAVPVLGSDGRHALGVIYLDATQKGIFDGQEVQTAILEASSGLVRYVSERYGT